MSDPVPSESPKTCPKCGAELSAGDTNGLCPACLMAEVMQPTQGDAKARRSAILSPEELAPLFPQYEILRVLGRGGMGAVYLARQISLNRLVAIKILPADLDGGELNFAERFKNEAQAMAQLSHPGIVAVYDFGQTTSGLLYIVMEYIEGTDVQQMVVQQGRLHSAHAMAITAHVCDALAYAHSRGIIHRDIKPSNIMVSNDGVVKVADFGLAKMSHSGQTTGITQSGVAMGTLHFMAPEALTLGVAVDQRADIYAVGVMLYQMLTGKLPQGLFEMPSLQVPGLDPRYDGIVAKALREDRNVRYQQASDLRHDLDAILTQPVVKVEPPEEKKTPAAVPPPAPKPQRPEGQPYRPPQPQVIVRTEKKGSPLLWLVVVVLSAAAAWMYWERSKEKDAATRVTSGDTTLPSPAVGSAIAPPATKDQAFVNTLGQEFVPVAGTAVLFCRWETRVKDYAEYARANKVDGAWATTNREGVPASREPEHPVASVNWADANAFCEWLTKKESAEGKLPKGMRYRLPTDEEWSRAVGLQFESGATPAQRSGKNSVDFPWGTGFPPSKTKVGNYADEAFHGKFPNQNAGDEDEPEAVKEPKAKNWIEGYTDGFATSAPVGSFPPNELGIYDLGGNVWEWCEDWYDASQKDRVVRGASWGSHDRGSLLSSDRNRNAPGRRHVNHGFRCVLAPASFAPPVVAIPQTPGGASYSTATKENPFVNTLGMKFVPVPGTEALFCIHETRRKDYAVYAGENTGVNPRWKTERVREHPEFVATDDHPVFPTNWTESKSFCSWLSRKEGITYRLPTDREWSFAIGIAANEDEHETPETLAGKLKEIYPWGTQWPPVKGFGNFNDRIQGYSDGFQGPAPVMSFKANSLGIYDLGGNVYEWCEDWFNAEQKDRVLRSCAWYNGDKKEAPSWPSSHRHHLPPDYQLGHNGRGFRCVVELASLQSKVSKTSITPTASPQPPSPSLSLGPTTWIDTKGRSITATFKGVQGDNVLLDIAGKVTPVPLNTLSAESQKQARELQSANPSTAASSGSSPASAGTFSDPPDTVKRVIELLPLAVSERVPTGPTWRQQGSDWVSAINSGAGIQFTHTPASKEFDYEIEFSVADPAAGTFRQRVPMNGKSVEWVMLFPGSSSGQRFGFPGLNTATTLPAAGTATFIARQRHRSLIKVRRDGISGSLDGVPLVHFQGDPGTGKDVPNRFLDSRFLSLIVGNAAVTLHKATITEFIPAVRTDLKSLPTTGWLPIDEKTLIADKGIKKSGNWFKLDKAELRPLNARDLALRVRFKAGTSITLLARCSEASPRPKSQYWAGYIASRQEVVLFRNWRDVQPGEPRMANITLATHVPTPALKPDEEHTLALLAVGDQLRVFLNDTLIIEKTDKLLPGTFAGFQGTGEMRDLEWIPLTAGR